MSRNVHRKRQIQSVSSISPVFLKGLYQVEWFYIRSVTLNWDPFFVDNEFCEVPFDKLAQSATLLMLEFKKVFLF